MFSKTPSSITVNVRRDVKAKVLPDTSVAAIVTTNPAAPLHLQKDEKLHKSAVKSLAPRQLPSTPLALHRTQRTQSQRKAPPSRLPAPLAVTPGSFAISSQKVAEPLTKSNHSTIPSSPPTAHESS